MMCIRKAKEGRRLSEHFIEDEFACPCCGTVLVQPDLVEKLEGLRRLAGGPVAVTSGYRCPAHNKTVGGVENSYHTQGMAADVFVCAISSPQLAEMAEQAGFDGIGVYQEQGFVHVDVRGYPARWEG